MKFYSDFQKDKTYNYKTFSLDGNKVAHEVNTKYLFAFSEGSQMKVEQFFFDKTFTKHFKEKGISFPENLKKEINDTKCRYILCQTEVISYDIDGLEFSRETSFQQHDKTSDIFHYQKGKKVSLKSEQTKTRSFNTIRKIDNLGNERTVLVPGGIHYNVKPGNLKDKHLSMLGYMTQIEVKMIDSLEII
jgi:hypothetical protein